MADEPQTNENKKSGGSMIGRLLIALFMGTVVGAECLFAYYWLPSEDQVQAATEKMIADAKEATDGGEKGDDSEIEVVEVDLGSFTVDNHKLNTDVTYRADFTLGSEVALEDQEEFEKLIARNKNRFRDQINGIMRNSTIDDFQDPMLDLIKRRFLAKSNELFGKEILRTMYIPEFKLLEL